MVFHRWYVVVFICSLTDDKYSTDRDTVALKDGVLAVKRMNI